MDRINVDQLLIDTSKFYTTELTTGTKCRIRTRVFKRDLCNARSLGSVLLLKGANKKHKTKQTSSTRHLRQLQATIL